MKNITGLPVPERIASLQAAEINVILTRGGRYLVVGRFLLDADTGHWHDTESKRRGSKIRALIEAIEDAGLCAP